MISCPLASGAEDSTFWHDDEELYSEVAIEKPTYMNREANRRVCHPWNDSPKPRRPREVGYMIPSISNSMDAKLSYGFAISLILNEPGVCAKYKS